MSRIIAQSKLTSESLHSATEPARHRRANKRQQKQRPSPGRIPDGREGAFSVLAEWLQARYDKQFPAENFECNPGGRRAEQGAVQPAAVCRLLEAPEIILI